MIKRLTRKLKNIYRWLPILWNDFDGDWGTTLIILKSKLRFERESIDKNNHQVNSKEIAREIAHAEKLIDMILNESWGETKHYFCECPGTWQIGEGRCNWCKHCLKDHIYNHSGVRFKILFNYLGKKMPNWWD